MDIDRLAIEVGQLKKDFASLKASPLGRIFEERAEKATAPQSPEDNSIATRVDEMKDHAQEVNRRLDNLDQSVGQGKASKIMEAVHIVEGFASRLDAIESRIEDIADHPALSAPPPDGAPRAGQAQSSAQRGPGTTAPGNTPRPPQQQPGGGATGKR